MGCRLLLVFARRFEGSQEAGRRTGSEQFASLSVWILTYEESEVFGLELFMCRKERAGAHSHLGGAVGVKNWRTAGKEVGAEMEPH